MPGATSKRRPSGLSDAAAGAFRIDVDLEEAERAAMRVEGWLKALRQRHALSRYEYTRHVRIVPAGKTFSHPILTLGTRFAESEDLLLATYLHEQMHWYLSRLGGFDHDPIAPFFDELVRRYPKAPTRLPEGARNFDQTYSHIVVCWLELKVVSEFIGWERAAALAETNYGYRWIYRTVVRDFEALEALLTAHGIVPIQAPDVLLKSPASVVAKSQPEPNGRAARSKSAGKGTARKSPVKTTARKAGAKAKRKANGATTKKARVINSGGRKKTPSKASPPRSRPGRRKSRARGGKTAR